MQAKFEIVPFERPGVLYLFIERKYHRNGTNGTLYVNGVKNCHTIELPWKDNRSQKSCIPEGTYKVCKRRSPRFGNHLQIADVPDRDFILFHPANNAIPELNGCIAPVTELTGEGCGSESRKAFEPLVETVYKAIKEGKEVQITLFSQKLLRGEGAMERVNKVFALG